MYVDLKSYTINSILNTPSITEILTGGVHGKPEISRQQIPSAFNDVDILPCALVKFMGNYPTYMNDDSINTPFDIYLYEPFNSNKIAEVCELLYQLLIDLKPGNVWSCEFLKDITDSEDPILKCQLGICSYQYVRLRS